MVNATPRPCRFTPLNDPAPIVQEDGWAPGLVWRGAESLARTGIRSPCLPASGESLCRLSHRDPDLLHTSPLIYIALLFLCLISEFWWDVVGMLQELSGVMWNQQFSHVGVVPYVEITGELSSYMSNSYQQVAIRTDCPLRNRFQTCSSNVAVMFCGRTRLAR